MIIFIPLRYALFSTLLVVFLTCLIIITIENNSYSYKLLTNPFSNFIAERSYSLFLWRWPIVASILWVNGKLTFLTNIFGIIALFAIATFSYEFIENKSKNLFSFKNQIKNIINLILINLGISFSLEIFSQQLMNERLYLYDALVIDSVCQILKSLILYFFDTGAI